MKSIITIAVLLTLAGCASSDPYRVNSFAPTPNRIACPTGSVVVVQKHGGGRLKSAGGERWSCEDEDAFEFEQDDSESWDEG